MKRLKRFRLGWLIWLVPALTLGCSSQPHPLTPSEAAMCRLELVQAYVRDIPDDVIYHALQGEPERLVAYLLAQKLKPEAVVDLVNDWVLCAGTQPSSP